MTPKASEAERCARCAADNPAWSAPSPLWNLVMRGNDINGEPRFGDMVCIKCFQDLAAESGVTGRWNLTVEPLPEELILETPSGRVWDWTTWLWVAP